ncbi:hypothetical protein IAE19_06130 [Acinetobacter sp. S40]|uniref:hypothetical protein n=1 Tax=unclassified Acinetobacter TaxID=196816 RepID=UPI00190C0CDE|nr:MULTISPECIES: hypothetical protein [unclassified Acinetobacter]MBJ9985023.1 hypothetical protein [Acinetobacter sp. S40]MBK0062986.1 hypothetical protein [Acinetobacter sp. S55]MBK0066596.1 hypothetical protein [Acinetobacter sp. S54]
MSKTHSLSIAYRFAVFYRFVIAFIVGFICTAFLSVALSYLFHLTFPKAESVYLAAFCAILFYALFVILAFCVQSLLKLTIYSIVISGICVFLTIGLG